MKDNAINSFQVALKLSNNIWTFDKHIDSTNLEDKQYENLVQVLCELSQKLDPKPVHLEVQFDELCSLLYLYKKGNWIFVINDTLSSFKSYV